MFKAENITIRDIISTPVKGLDYIPQEDEYRPEFETYAPQEDVLAKIKAWLDSNGEQLTIIAFGATWCGDCKIQLPRLVKMDKLLGISAFHIDVFGGIKTKPPYDRKPGDLIWKSPPSPPEAVDKRFDMYHIPAIFLFNKAGICIGKIDEKPQHTPTIEEEVLHYLK